MTEYHVTWTIELDADSAEDAAKNALAIHRDSSSLATVFTVNGEQIDLEDSCNSRPIDLAILSIEVDREDDATPDLSWLDQTDDEMGEGFAAKAAQRKASYLQSWHMIGIRATAQIALGSLTQRIESGGVYGIESDSDEMYLREVEREQISELGETLEGLGFSAEAIREATPTDIRSEIEES